MVGLLVVVKEERGLGCGCLCFGLGILAAEEVQVEETGVDKAFEDTVVLGEGDWPTESDIVWTGDKTYFMRSPLSLLFFSSTLSGLRSSGDPRREEMEPSGQST